MNIIKELPQETYLRLIGMNFNEYCNYYRMLYNDIYSELCNTYNYTPEEIENILNYYLDDRLPKRKNYRNLDELLTIYETIDFYYCSVIEGVMDVYNRKHYTQVMYLSNSSSYRISNSNIINILFRKLLDIKIFINYFLYDYGKILNIDSNSKLYIVDDNIDYRIKREKLMNLIRFSCIDNTSLIVKSGLYKYDIDDFQDTVYLVSAKKVNNDIIFEISAFDFASSGYRYHKYNLSFNNFISDYLTGLDYEYDNDFMSNLNYNYNVNLDIEDGIDVYTLIMLYLDMQNQNYTKKQYQMGRSSKKSQNRVSLPDDVKNSVHVYNYKPKFLSEKSNNTNINNLNRHVPHASTEKCPHVRREHNRHYNSGKTVPISKTIIHKDKYNDKFYTARKIK